MEKEQFVISAFVQRAMLYSNVVTIGKTLRTTWPTTAQATFGKTIRTTWSTTAQVTLTTKTTTQCWSRTIVRVLYSYEYHWSRTIVRV